MTSHAAGGCTWQHVKDLYDNWAKHNHHPVQSLRLLEVRFKAVGSHLFIDVLCL